ncbi:hypothetical protein QFZ94_005182 [Paraburkholderia sp. JPY465]
MSEPTLDPNHRPLTDIALTAQALKNSGGAERYTRDVIAGLHRLGLRPTLFAREIDRALPEAAWIDAQPLNVRWAPRKLRNLAFDWRLKQRLKRHRPACVFSINHSTHADVALCGGTHPGSLEAAGRTPRRSDEWQIELERRVYTRARAIVAHSQLMSRELQRFYHVPAQRIDVLYPPVDTARFKPLDAAARAAMRRQLGVPDDRVMFVFSSTSHERKGYPLLEAFFSRTTLPVCLVVAGRPVPKTGDTIRYAGYSKEIEKLFAAARFHRRRVGVRAVRARRCRVGDVRHAARDRRERRLGGDRDRRREDRVFAAVRRQFRARDRAGGRTCEERRRAHRGAARQPRVRPERRRACRGALRSVHARMTAGLSSRGAAALC